MGAKEREKEDIEGGGCGKEEVEGEERGRRGTEEGGGDGEAGEEICKDKIEVRDGEEIIEYI